MNIEIMCIILHFLFVQGNTAVIVCGSRAHLQDEAVAQVRDLTRTLT